MDGTPRSKLTGEERQAAIVKAVRRVFAEKGFHATTTRELAAAAGVSEALLFKHFPTKEALYEAMQRAWLREMDHEKIRLFETLEPSAETLVRMTHELVSHVLGLGREDDPEEQLQHRLMCHSMLGDGEFARYMIRSMPPEGPRKTLACIRAAVAAGEAYEGGVNPDLAHIFAFHLLGGIRLHMMQKVPVIDHGMTRIALVDQVVRYILRGYGIKESVIERYYPPRESTAPAE